MAENARIKPVERATKRTWDEWLAFMDRIGAQDLDHKAIALQVYEEIDETLDQRGWWTQAVTVAYEQHIGRRIPGQRPDGTFQTSVSRSTSLGMRELMDRWESFAAGDEGVLAIVGGEPRVSGTERRITWRAKAADGSSVVVISEPKKNGTASLVVQHMGLATLELNEAARERWAGIVARFLDEV
ncbi:hypothetical protein ACI78T_13820 [Blastococcus sp. SYSU D00922]